MDRRETRPADEARHYLSTCSGLMFACLLAYTLQLFFFSPISPDPLVLPSPTLSSTNHHLQRVIKLGEGLLEKPEGVCVNEKGVVYTATRDGWIKRLHPNGSVEDWKFVGGPNLLGITTTASSNHVLVCDTEKGLLKVGEEGVTTLASHVNGSEIRFADDVIEASDGSSVYFSVASTKFGFHEWYLDVLEAKPHGQLLKYDPVLNETSVLLHDLCFANGVALSRDQDYLVVCESWKCLKYWLKGKLKGEIEIFVDNLPGAPDNINLAPDGTFWIALIQVTKKKLEFVHTSGALKHLVASSQKLTKLVSGAESSATVVNVATDGQIIRKFEDPDGKIMSFVTSAVEFENHLYLGSLDANFIGKLPLNDL